MAANSSTPPSQQVERDLDSAIRALRNSVEAKLRRNAVDAHGHRVPADQLDSLHQALEELRVGWEDLQAQSERMARDREHYAELFREAPDAYVVTDGYAMISEVNRAARELLRYTPSNLAKKPLELFVTTEHRSAFRTNLNAMLAQEAKPARTWSGALGRGSSPPVNVEFTVGAVRSSGGTTRLCWVLRRQG